MKDVAFHFALTPMRIGRDLEAILAAEMRELEQTGPSEPCGPPTREGRNTLGAGPEQEPC